MRFAAAVMKWGTGNEAARERIQSPELTKSSLEGWGVTVEIAEAWRDFYKELAEKSPFGPETPKGNPSAQGRFELMRCAGMILLAIDDNKRNC